MSRDETPDVRILRFPQDAGSWHLVRDYMELRKRVFIDRMAWDLHSTTDALEFEQYDALDAIYVMASRRDGLVGGARLLRTDRRFGSGRVRYSYMIRDAHLGLLPGLPSGLCTDAPPSSPDVWELTRLISDGGARVAGSILDATNAYLKSRSAHTCLFLGPRSFMRMASRMGYDPQPLGAEVGNGSGRFLAFACRVI